MLLPRVLLAAGFAAVLADAAPVLHVLRAAPMGQAAPTAPITVTFDRPVAGSLDRTVDPDRVLRLEPALPGTADWRDPVTLRFRPARPLAPGTRVRVTVLPDFTAMDGSRLAEPYRFDFTVRGPKVLAGIPVSEHAHPRFLTPRATFDLVLDAPAETAALERAVHVQPGAACAGGREPIRLTLVEQRTLREDDPWQVKEAGGWDRDRAADSLRRLVRLRPVRSLPLGCGLELVFPTRLDAEGGEPVRWGFETYGAFRLASANCGRGMQVCPEGPAVVFFGTPVRGAEVLRRVRLIPETKFVVRDTTEERDAWPLEAELRPRTGYAVVVDTAIRDVFGQRLTGNVAAGFSTTGYAPAVDYARGRATVERNAFRTFAVTHVNVDSLDLVLVPVPRAKEAAFLVRGAWAWDEVFDSLASTARRRRFGVRNERDRAGVYGLPLPVADAARPDAPTLYALQVTSPGLDSFSRRRRPVAVVQVTDLGVHAKIGVSEGAVWVTGASDGRPRAGAAVTLHDIHGRVLATATSDAGGLARLGGYRALPARRSPDGSNDPDSPYTNFEGYVAVHLAADRALVPVNQSEPELSSWQFGVSSAWGPERHPAAGAVFTERDLYRPGEPVYAKAIVRAGPLGRLTAASPGDTLRWQVLDREGTAVRTALTALSRWGTAQQTWRVPGDAPLGQYQVTAEVKRQGRWLELARSSYRVAEYRPPEFLVDVTTEGGAGAAGAAPPKYAGDSLAAQIEARYLFGAPMGRAAASWQLRQERVNAWELEIPNTDGFQVGETAGWWDESDQGPQVRVLEEGRDTLSAAGRLAIGVRLPAGSATETRPMRATVEATITDVNRQTVSDRASVLVHPASFYLAAKPAGTEWFWRAGRAVEVGVTAVRPDGRRVAGVAVQGTVVRREWHQVRRERDGYGELVGEWVTDTVARCRLTTAEGALAPCRFTPKAGGTYQVTLAARDERGRGARTSFVRWAVGDDWVPWNDETQFKMDVVADRQRYAPGDTATVLFASPFVNAEAWVTLEREGLIEQRRLRITSGTTTLKLPITEAHAPNVFVSIVVARGRSAKPGPLDDPGRPTIRVGYAELRVTPEKKRLAVEVAPLQAGYRPGDTARVRLRVRDAAGAGQAGEVTLWAVDEGVLSLTGFKTPDPLDLVYQPRGLGLRLGSNLASVAPQVPEGQKGRVNPGGGGGMAGSEVLRSRFQTTAFFLGSVETDAQGNAVAAAKLPDNLTTFRVMAVAVTRGDRFGSGEAKLLVTRPLVARPALPRFLREGDRAEAGVVVNHRLGGTPSVRVQAQATGGARLAGAAARQAALAAGRGTEVRFDLRALAGAAGDSAVFRFDALAQGSAERDAVRLAIPVRDASPPRVTTLAGVTRDTASALFTLPAGTDPARSRLVLSLAASPLAVLEGAREYFDIYPYGCTEQIASGLRPLVALYSARRAYRPPGAPASADSSALLRMRTRIAQGVESIERRQRPDGGIGLWDGDGWTTPWLTAYAGQALLDAKAAGVPVRDSVLARVAQYLTASLATPAQAAAQAAQATPVAQWYQDRPLWLSDRVMAVDYLSRAGRRARAAENELLRLAAQLTWEDRARLAEVVARGGDRAAARQLLAPLWAAVTVEGRRAVLPAASGRDFYFLSTARPAAFLLQATLAVEPAHPLIGPLVERLVAQGRDQARVWNTQDLGTTVDALHAYARVLDATSAAGATVRVRAGGRVVLERELRGASGRGAEIGDSSVALTGLSGKGAEGAVTVPVTVEVRGGGAPVFWFLSVSEVSGAPVERPDDRGIQVERWYEDYATGKPLTSVSLGALVRVRLRVTVPRERHMVVLDDPLPAGLEAVDLSLRTAGGLPGPGAADSAGMEDDGGDDRDVETPGGHERWDSRWAYGGWDAGWWTPFEHRELRDDRVVWFATVLWPGSYTASYVARATTPGTFRRPPAHAEEMYDRAVNGRSDGGAFEVTAK